MHVTSVTNDVSKVIHFIHQDNMEDNSMDNHSSGSSHEYASEHEEEKPSSD